MDFTLTPKERELLREEMRRTKDVRVMRRAQALLWLAEGERVSSVARRQGVSRQTVYDWLGRFRERQGGKIGERLKDLPRPGRPPEKRQQAFKVIPQVIERSPQEFGYRHSVWVVPLMKHYLKVRRGIEVSESTLRRALHGLGYRYRRPKYVLSRRSPHWKKAKGGSRKG